jgi:hypothetical protein
MIFGTWMSTSRNLSVGSQISIDSYAYLALSLQWKRKAMGAKKKNPNAVALGSKGGKARANKLSAAERSAIAKKGGKARLKSTSDKERAEIARKAAQTRWASKGEG